MIEALVRQYLDQLFIQTNAVLNSLPRGEVTQAQRMEGITKLREVLQSQVMQTGAVSMSMKDGEWLALHIDYRPHLNIFVSFALQWNDVNEHAAYVLLNVASGFGAFMDEDYQARIIFDGAGFVCEIGNTVVGGPKLDYMSILRARG